MRLVSRLNRWYHSRGLPRTRHGGIEIRASEPAAEVIRQALVLIAEFHPAAIRRVEDAFDVIIDSWMPRWFSLAGRTAYMNTGELDRNQALTVAAVLLRWGTSVRTNKRRVRLGLTKATPQTLQHIVRTSVRQMRSFLAWYGLTYDLPEGDRIALFRWTEAMIAHDGRSRRAQMWRQLQAFLRA